MNYSCEGATRDRKAVKTKANYVVGHRKYIKKPVSQFASGNQVIYPTVRQCKRTITFAAHAQNSSQSESVDLLDICPLMFIEDEKSVPPADLLASSGRSKNNAKRSLESKPDISEIAQQNELSEDASLKKENSKSIQENSCMSETESDLEQDLPQKYKGRSWSDKESELLRLAMAQVYPLKWTLVAEYVNSRNEGCSPKTGQQCRQRWMRVEAPSTKKGRWTKKEDLQLIDAVLNCPPKNWSMISALLPGRVDIQVRKRLQRLGKYLVQYGILSEEHLPSGLQ